MQRALVLPLLCLSLTATGAGTGDGLAELDALFARRDEAGRLEELEQRLRDELRAQPDSFEHVWRLSRVLYWQADAMPDKAEKKRLGYEGWQYGDRAARLNPKRAEGHYYAAICIGVYGDGAGLFAALAEGLEGKFLERIDRAIGLDAWLDRGGPLVARGRYHFSMPWPKRDNRRARELYEYVLARHPGNVRARYYLAQLELREGNPRAAREAIAKVQATPESSDPPEERRIKSWSERVRNEAERALR
ncbi:MAG: tetratricopeptide repeat protein [Myxococcaceae bacterium]|nr:tetratricopeptide repeat protein [Myxococcaceae bacterium]MCI0673945.1 tetratricopeptide repeat protein [Myxococcaceae bacterium]